MNRIKTGIQGLDELIEGGFPEGSSILLSGGPGAGKSIFCIEFLYNGAKDYNEPGLYVTLEEGPQNLWWNMQRFHWELSALQRKDMFKIVKFEPDENVRENFNVVVEKILTIVKQMGAKRCVIDSITAFSFWTENLGKIRFAIYTLIEELRKLNCTTIMTCETSGKKTELSRFGIEDFLTDGVILLLFQPPQRILFVRKMRGTNNSKNAHPIIIDDNGLKVSSEEKISWDELKE